MICAIYKLRAVPLHVHIQTTKLIKAPTRNMLDSMMLNGQIESITYDMSYNVQQCISRNVYIYGQITWYATIVLLSGWQQKLPNFGPHVFPCQLYCMQMSLDNMAPRGRWARYGQTAMRHNDDANMALYRQWVPRLIIDPEYYVNLIV